MWSRAEKRKSREEEEAVTLLGENLFSASLIFLWSHFRTRQHWLAEVILSIYIFFCQRVVFVQQLLRKEYIYIYTMVSMCVC